MDIRSQSILNSWGYILILYDIIRSSRAVQIFRVFLLVSVYRCDTVYFQCTKVGESFIIICIREAVVRKDVESWQGQLE